MKLKKPGFREILIFMGSLILFFLLIHYWDEVKGFIAGILHI